MFWQSRKPKQGVRNAIVTASSSRVGYAIAEALITEGWRVVIHGRDEERTLNAKISLGATGAIVGDLNEQDTIDALGEATEYFFDRELTLLVNNASTFVHDPRDMTLRGVAFEKAMESAKWVYESTHCLQTFLGRSGGLVVNLTDMAAEEAWPGYIAHAASKTAIETMTTHFNHQWKREGMSKRNAACVALRLPMVLAPDGLTHDEEQALYSKFGAPVGCAAVSQAILDMSRTHRLGHVMELTPEGTTRGVA